MNDDVRTIGPRHCARRRVCVDYIRADLADAVAALAWWRKSVDPKISSPLIKETDRILNAKGGRT